MPHASAADVKQTLDKALSGKHAGGKSVPLVLNEIFTSDSGDPKDTFIQDLNLPTWMASALNNTIIKDKDSTITTNENNTESLVEEVNIEFTAGVTPPQAAIEGNTLGLYNGFINVVVKNENKADVNLSLTLKEGVSFLTFGVDRTVELDTGLEPGKEQSLAKALAFLAPRSSPPIKLNLSSLTIIETLAILTQQSEDSVANTLKLRLPYELFTGAFVTDKLDAKHLVVINFAYTQKGQSDDAKAQVQTWTLRIVPKLVDRIGRVPLKESQIEIQAIDFDYKRNRVNAPSLSVEGIAMMKHGDKSILLSLDKNGFAFTSGFYEKELTDIDYASIISSGAKTLQPDLGQLPGLTFDKKVIARGRTFVVIQSLEGSEDPSYALMSVRLYARVFLFAIGGKKISPEIVYELDRDTWINKSKLEIDGIANEVGKAQEMTSLIEPRLGKAILGSVEFSSALFSGMDASKWSDEIVTTLLSRKITPPNVVEASRRLPVPDDNIKKWLADLDKDTADLKAAPVMQKAYPIYCKISRNVTAFNTVVSARKMVLEGMIKDLEANLEADIASQLAKSRTTLANLTKAVQTGTSRVAELLAYLRNRLNQANPIIGVYLPNTGRVEIWWGRPKPGTFLHDENTWADRDTSHVVWEQTIRPQNVYPSDDSRASLEWHHQDGNIMSRRIGSATSDYNYYDQWKNGNCYAWIRANYEENDYYIASEKWTPVTLFVLDEKFAARFAKIFFLDAKPTVSINGPFINGDWYGNVSKNLEPEMQEFMRHEQLKWDVSISPTNDPNHGDAWRGTKKQGEMSHEQMDTKFVRWSNVWFHVRPVIDYERNTKRCEGLWVGAESKRRPISNKLGPGDCLGVDEYLIVKSNVPGTTNISFRFKLDERWQFRLDKVDEKSTIVRALWAEGPDDRFSNDHVTMQKDGNLIVQSSIWHTKWESHTANNENAGSSLVLREDGNAVILRPNGTVAWQTNTVQLQPISEKNKLKYGEQLEADQNLWSPDGKYRFCPQKDNNLVTYGPGGVKWSSNTAWRNWRSDREGDRMEVGDDDNLSWFLKGGNCRWNTDTRRRKTGGRGFLELQNDGNLIFKSDGIILWSNEKKLIQPYEPLDLTPVKQPSDRLRAGESLERSSTLTSANGMFKLSILTDGQLIIRCETPNAIIWTNGKTSNSVSRVCFGGIKFDIAMFDTASKPLWGPFVADSNSMLHLNNDGNLSILPMGADPNNYEDLGKRKWSSNTSFPFVEEEGKPCTKAGRSLRAGQMLAANHSLTSKSGEYTFTITETGEFKITRDSGRTISTIGRMAQNANSSQPARLLLLGSDGYLELRSTVTGPTLWREGNSAAKRLMLNDQGLLFLTQSTNEKETDPDVLWTLPKTLGDRISTGESMYANQNLRSPAGNYELVYQVDGNLVLYRKSPDTRVMWASGSDGKRPKKLVVQGDGNVVLYVDDWPPAPWASGTNADGDNAKREFVLLDNGDVVILENGKQIWSLH